MERCRIIFLIAFAGCASTGLDLGEADATIDIGDDAGLRADTPSVDVGFDARDAGFDVRVESDTGPVLPMPPPTCAPEAIIDLDEEGERRGEVTHFVGSNAGVSVVSSVYVRGASRTLSAALAFYYTPRASTRLLLSINNPGTDPGFIPRVWVLDRCTDEVTRQLYDSQPPGGPYNGPSAAVLAGVPLTVVVAGTFRQLTGRFELTVRELPLVALGERCSIRPPEDSCTRATACIGEGFAPRDGVCVERGPEDAPCRLDPPFCNTGFSCSGSPSSPRSVCLTSVEAGGACGDGACVAGSYCAGGTCTARGTLDNQCDAGNVCDDPLSCVGSFCRPVARLGEACLPPPGGGPKCLGEQSCVGRVCVVHGSEGADCRGETQECGPGLRCRQAAFGGRSALCLPPAEVGQECRSQSCTEGASCRRRFECVQDGTEGGQCRGEGAECDDGLSCAEVRIADLSLDDTCQPVFEGGRCREPPEHACPRGTVCAGFERDELFCLARTGAEDAPCRIEGTACNPGLVCRYVDGITSAPLCRRP